ncbi:hypothetical protein BWI17_00595 [Betaproteobacteria bacterium GR16-43]|nr:hypothetical protein BWI17_00595 [Betaproteobacteria bacterium GR16-43]
MFIPPRYVLAPYLPTPHNVVEGMLRLADVKASDTVYDLGCGDGRLVISAAETRGARGLGVDIEPYWVEQSRLNASAAGVSHLARFEQADALDLDLSPATVVFAYLVHWSTRLVAQHFVKSARPGTRLVSHSFPIELGPTRSESVVAEDGTSRIIHLFIAPSSS